MRVGLDVRALQVQGGSETRGIGRYVAGLLDSFATGLIESRPVLFALADRPLPEDWASRFEVVPVEGKVYERASFPAYLRLPKLRSTPTLLGRLHAEAVESQRQAMGRAIEGAKLDVLHRTAAVDAGNLSGGECCVPVVATFHDAIPLLHQESLYDLWMPFLQRFYDRQLADLRHLSRIVAVSEASRRDAIRLGGLPPDRVVVIHPSIPGTYGTPVDEATRARVRSRYGLKGPFALFCSVPDPHKNPERVVRAFAQARLEGSMLVFVSPDEEPVLRRLRGFAASSGLSPTHWTVTGRIPEADLVALFQEARCLVSPSLIEGFGLPAAQALAAGLPAIVSSRGSQPEVVGDAGIVVDPEDVDAIAETLQRLWNDASRREDLARRGRERAALFTPERQAREIEAVYRSVL